MLPPKNTEPRFPDYLPYLRLSGPICRSGTLREAKSTMLLEIPAKFRQQMTGKEIIDLRILVTIEAPPQRTNEVQPTPGEIIARRKVGAFMMESKVEPKWVKFKGCFVNEVPLDVTAMAFEKANKRGGIKCEIEVNLEILGDSRACAVGDFFISRHIEEQTLRRSILAMNPFERSIVEKKQANLADSGIDSWIVSLKCPLLSIRIRTPVRFESCQHLECFDLDAFISMEMRRPKGRCPVCNRVVEIRTLGVCDFTKEMLKENPDCESYRISETDIRPISNEEKQEVVAPRKRKRMVVEGVLDDTENQLGAKRERLDVNRSCPTVPISNSDDCVVILDD